jgi:hypothetical protein
MSLQLRRASDLSSSLLEAEQRQCCRGERLHRRRLTLKTNRRGQAVKQNCGDPHSNELLASVVAFIQAHPNESARPVRRRRIYNTSFSLEGQRSQILETETSSE